MKFSLEYPPEVLAFFAESGRRGQEMLTPAERKRRSTAAARLRWGKLDASDVSVARAAWKSGISQAKIARDLQTTVTRLARAGAWK
jgi:hypothetical protein